MFLINFLVLLIQSTLHFSFQHLIAVRNLREVTAKSIVETTIIVIIGLQKSEINNIGCEQIRKWLILKKLIRIFWIDSPSKISGLN